MMTSTDQRRAQADILSRLVPSLRGATPAGLQVHADESLILPIISISSSDEYTAPSAFLRVCLPIIIAGQLLASGEKQTIRTLLAGVLTWASAPPSPHCRPVHPQSDMDQQ